MEWTQPELSRTLSFEPNRTGTLINHIVPGEHHSIKTRIQSHRLILHVESTIGPIPKLLDI